jgi:hypothetical protein
VVEIKRIQNEVESPNSTEAILRQQNSTPGERQLTSDPYCSKAAGASAAPRFNSHPGDAANDGQPSASGNLAAVEGEHSEQMATTPAGSFRQ